MNQSDGQMYNPPQMAHNYQPQTQPGVQTAMTTTSPQSPNSNDGQHLGVQTYPPQQNQTQPSGQYQGQTTVPYQSQPIVQTPQQQWQPQIQQPMQQSYPPSVQSPVQVVYQPTEDPNLNGKIMAYKVAKWVQLVFVIIEFFWIVILLFSFENKSDEEKWYSTDPKLTAILVGVSDAFGIATPLMDSTVCQIIHFVLTCLHLWTHWYREFIHFCIALVLLVFMCLGWNELERNRWPRIIERPMK